MFTHPSFLVADNFHSHFNSPNVFTALLVFAGSPSPSICTFSIALLSDAWQALSFLCLLPISSFPLLECSLERHSCTLGIVFEVHYNGWKHPCGSWNIGEQLCIKLEHAYIQNGGTYIRSIHILWPHQLSCQFGACPASPQLCVVKHRAIMSNNIIIWCTT